MAIPIYLWLKDEAGNAIKGSVKVQGREESVEVNFFYHHVSLAVDGSDGHIKGTRQYSPVLFEKELDAASPYLYQALATGKKLTSATFLFYRIDCSGQEEVYFIISLDDVHVVTIDTGMDDINTPYGRRRNPSEFIEISFEKITWHYVDGNIKHSESWDNRKTV